MRVPSLLNFVLVTISCGLVPSPVTAQEGCVEKYCNAMTSCAEAVYHLNVCGHSKRDRDNDGIPCESVCGKTQVLMNARVAAEPYSPVGPSATSLGIASLAQTTYTCGKKTKCNQMLTCGEAKHYLKVCGLKRIDGNRDGVPCSGLCRK